MTAAAATELMAVLAFVAPPSLPGLAEAVQSHPPGDIVFFGGPDRKDGLLRDLLEARIRATPPGGRIDWATYYFRDPGLAEALVEAHRRGVKVRVSLERRPLQRDANDETVATLKSELGGGLRLRKPALGLPTTGHLHAKIYGFSGPQPSVLVGSFNPSGGVEETYDLGDQDRGYNLLVELKDPVLVEALSRQARRAGKMGWPLRLTPRQNRRVISGETALYFYPRLRPGVIERSLHGLGPGDRVEGAISHIASGPLVSELQRAARAGARVSLVVHASARRAPPRVVEALRRAGVEITRYRDDDDLPMHAKALIVQRGGVRTAWFGSFNFNLTSRWLNREVLVRTTDPEIVAPLSGRVGQIRQAALRAESATLSRR